MAFETVYRIGAKGQADVLIRLEGGFFSLKKNGFSLLDQTDIYMPIEKPREVVDYIELDGEELGERLLNSHGDPVAYQAYDYFIELFYGTNILTGKAGNESSFAYALRDMIRRFHHYDEIELVNTFTGVHLFCTYISNEIKEQNRQKFKNIKDATIVRVNFRVAKPFKCNYQLRDFKTAVEYLSNETEVQSLYPYYNIRPDYTDESLANLISL